MMEQFSDVQLLDALQNDPLAAEKALTGIFDRYYTYLCVVAYHIVDSREDARDIVCDVFCQIWSKKGSDRLNIVNLKPYLLVSVFNSARSWKKRERSRSRRERRWDDKHFTVTEADFERAVIQTEFYTSLYAAIDKLPATTGRVMLSYMQGYNTDEISESLGLAPQTVRNHKTRAITLLKTIFQENKLLILYFSLIELMR